MNADARPGHMQRFKQRMGEGVLTAVDVVFTVVPGAGAAVVAVLGRVMLAAVLAAIALGFFLRLVRRKRSVAAAAPPKPSLGMRVGAAGAAIVSVAVLVEATRFPVRFDQPGFEIWHWAVVLAALMAGYSLCLKLIGAVLAKRRSAERGIVVDEHQR